MLLRRLLVTLYINLNSRPIRSGSSLTAPSFSGPGRGVSTAPRPSEEELQVPCCHPYGVQAMWSERSRHRRLGTDENNAITLKSPVRYVLHRGSSSILGSE